jgi:hypothetical protein
VARRLFQTFLNGFPHALTDRDLDKKIKKVYREKGFSVSRNVLDKQGVVNIGKVSPSLPLPLSQCFCNRTKQKTVCVFFESVPLEPVKEPRC